MIFSDTLLAKLAEAKKVAVLTGAGISAESGVATFRGADGIWQKFKPEELASMDAFLRNPRLVWEWYDYRRKLLQNVQPNPGHMICVEMENFFPHFAVTTQNVDGLHHKAGSRNVFELHGNILRNKCIRCSKYCKEIAMTDSGVPQCECGGYIRPDVVWFGEFLPQEILDTAFREAENADVYFSIGTSAVVYPAAMLPLQAKQFGAYVVEINLEPTSLSSLVDESIMGKSGEILPQLWSVFQETRH